VGNVSKFLEQHLSTCLIFQQHPRSGSAGFYVLRYAARNSRAKLELRYTIEP
jgi:hypothetical protein